MPPKSKIPKKPPNKIQLSLGAKQLTESGPCIPAAWAVHPKLAEEMAKRGEAVPPPIEGAMLVDTGATFSCMAASVASGLSLKPVDFCDVYGAGGKSTNAVFEALLIIPISHAHGYQVQIARAGRYQGIPELEKMATQIINGDTGAKVRFIGLLGRDFLQFCQMSYNGVGGHLQLLFDEKWLKKVVAWPPKKIGKP